MRDLNGTPSFILLLLFIIFFAQAMNAQNGLSVGFYKDSCPQAERIVSETVRRNAVVDPQVPAGLLRLFFHDCFVKGCDASILLDATPDGGPVEKASPANFALRGVGIVDEAKAVLESECPSTVSCADIIAFAARDATDIAGVPAYPVPAGRRDGTSSHLLDTLSLPSPAAAAAALIRAFAAKGFSKADLVVLSGAHSIGGAHCPTFKERLYNHSGHPYAETQDPRINDVYAQMLKSKCPKMEPLIPEPDFGTKVPFNEVSIGRLDVRYYAELEKGKGLLSSDQELMNDVGTSQLAKMFARNPSRWARMFRTAMVKLAGVEVLVGDQGQIRRNCRFVNSD